MKTDSTVRRAQKQYRCIGGPDHVCNAIINPGDVYFAFTLHSSTSHRSRRYCIECAYRNHPDLLKESMKSIKTEAKRKAAGRRVGSMSFLSAQRRNFKRKPTLPEQLFWEQLKTSGIKIKFLQQQMIHGFIVDFWAPEDRLAIELDGVQHLSRKSKDLKRDEVLRSHGVIVLRFPAQIVYSDINFVFERIKEVLQKRKGAAS